MTPADVANRNVALLMTLAAVGGALAWAGWWLLTSDHPIAARFRALMSRLHIIGDDDEADDEPVRHQVPRPVSVSATPNTDDTRQVSGATDASARDIIRASVIAELLDSGIITNRDKAIMRVFKCSKASASRPDAPFQVALRLVEQHRMKQPPEYVGDAIARIEREVANGHE
jgi:hypothetical protein